MTLALTALTAARAPPARPAFAGIKARLAILRRSKNKEYSHAIVRVGGSSAARAGEEARGHRCQYAVKDGDTGSPEVQVALLTERIRDLNGAPRAASRRITIRAAASSSSWVSAGAFLRISIKKDATRYRAVIGSLGLRR